MTASSEQGRADEVLDAHETSCCVVGGGPGGMMLALLLARRGVPVTLLEAHPTFERDFRGDTIHPGLLEILDEIGLADRLHERQHVMWMPQPIFLRFIAEEAQQPIFLRFIAEEAQKYPSFRLHLRDLAEVQRQREWPTRVIQAIGAFALGRMGRALRSGRQQTVPRFVPLLFGAPVISKVTARMLAFGLWRVHVQE